jgi:hypothetical protein
MKKFAHIKAYDQIAKINFNYFQIPFWNYLASFLILIFYIGSLIGVGFALISFSR